MLVESVARNPRVKWSVAPIICGSEAASLPPTRGTPRLLSVASIFRPERPRCQTENRPRLVCLLFEITDLEPGELWAPELKL